MDYESWVYFNDANRSFISIITPPPDPLSPSPRSSPLTPVPYRVLKTGTLEWYYENLRTRFRNFGSVKVMQSLFKRLRTDRGESTGESMS